MGGRPRVGGHSLRGSCQGRGLCSWNSLTKNRKAERLRPSAKGSYTFMEVKMEERIVMADPVADPQGYQRELLALLGGQDLIAVLAATPRAFRERVAGLPEDLFSKRPASKE